ncbi:MAG: GNAT family N-acetyltransferase [Thermoplasmata archaeon]|nr:GNAT family N-acetyltransferase [Thermoplasmata archaeon]
MMVEPLRPGDLAEAEGIYLEAFPEWERTGFGKLLDYLERGDAELLGLYDGSLKGMAYTIFDDGILFILYLAVSWRERGKGLGTEALESVISRYPGRVAFLNVEPPDAGSANLEQREARMRFYTRAGFAVAGRLVEDDGDFLTLCRGGRLSPEDFDSFHERHDFSLLFDGSARLVPR